MNYISKHKGEAAEEKLKGMFISGEDLLDDMNHIQTRLSDMQIGTPANYRQGWTQSIIELLLYITRDTRKVKQKLPKGTDE